MKRIFSVLLILYFLMGITACSNSQHPEANAVSNRSEAEAMQIKITVGETELFANLNTSIWDISRQELRCLKLPSIPM